MLSQSLIHSADCLQREVSCTTSAEASAVFIPDIAYIPLTQGHSAVIDAADHETLFLCEFQDGLFWAGRVCDRQWYAFVKPHTTYAVTKVAGIEMRLHRLIMCARFGQLIDHKDHDGLNCQRTNLRRTGLSGNAQNRRLNRGRELPKGVSFHKQSGKFHAYIRQDGKLHSLGLHRTPHEAAVAYNAAALERFGDFACLNVLEATP